MPSALFSTTDLLHHFEPTEHIRQDACPSWLLQDPLMILWADKILVPAAFHKATIRFHDFDVGFKLSNETIERSLHAAWTTLFDAGIIQPIIVGDHVKEAATVAMYGVQNRLRQTAEDGLVKLNTSSAVDLNQPAKVLRLSGESYCVNHLDYIASTVIVASECDALWIPNEREASAIQWLYRRGLDPNVSFINSGAAVLEALPALRFPDFRYIPPVGACASCGGYGKHCFSESYGPDQWVAASKTRLNKLIDLRERDEIRSFRKILNDITADISAQKISTSSFRREKAIEALQDASRRAAERLVFLDETVKTYCDIVELYSFPLAIVGTAIDAGMLGLWSTIVAGTSKAVSVSAQTILKKPHRWITMRNLRIDDNS